MSNFQVDTGGATRAQALKDYKQYLLDKQKKKDNITIGLKGAQYLSKIHNKDITDRMFSKVTDDGSKMYQLKQPTSILEGGVKNAPKNLYQNLKSTLWRTEQDFELTPNAAKTVLPDVKVSANPVGEVSYTATDKLGEDVAGKSGMLGKVGKGALGALGVYGGVKAMTDSKASTGQKVGGAISATLGANATLGALGLANAWNPLGWAALGATALGTGLSFLGGSNNGRGKRK